MIRKSIVKYVGAGFICAFVAAAMPYAGTSDVATVEASQSVITKSAAKEIVLKASGFEDSQIKEYTVKLEGKGKNKEYEISFVKGAFRYEYELNAYTGKIKDKDIDRVSISDADATKDIGKSKAKSIALNKAGRKASDVSGMEVKLKTEKGYRLYKVEFEDKQYEYEYEIDAYTGKVLDADRELLEEDD